MFKVLRATKRGNHIAEVSSQTAMSIANALLADGVGLRASDNGDFMNEAYAYYVTMSLADWMNDVRRGQMMVHAGEILQDWFAGASLAQAMPAQRASTLDGFVDNLVAFAGKWMTELIEENPDREFPADLKEAASERLTWRLDSILSARFPELDIETRNSILIEVRSQALAFEP